MRYTPKKRQTTSEKIQIQCVIVCLALFLFLLLLLLFVLFKASDALLCFKCADEHLIVVATSASGRVDGGLGL